MNRNFICEKPQGVYYDLYAHNATPWNRNFHGINAVYHPFDFFEDKMGRNYTEKQLEIELNRLEQAGIRMVRSYYCSSLTWNPETKEHDFESSRMQDFYRFCLELQKRGIEIGLFATWSMKTLLVPPEKPDEIPCRASLAVGYGIAVRDDLEASCRNYRAFIKNSVLAFERHGIHNIKCFFAFTECNNSFVRESNAETMLEKRDYERLYPIYHAGIAALDDGLRDAGMRDRYQIVAPCDNWRNDQGGEPYSLLVRYTLQNLNNRVDVIGSHNGYDRADKFSDDWYYVIPKMKLQRCCDEVRAAGKEFWVNEYNVAVQAWNLEAIRSTQDDPWKGTALGAMVASIMDMGASNVFLWALCDQLFTDCTTNNFEFDNGLQIVGYLPSLRESAIPHPAWYACSLIMKYVGAGTVYRCEQSAGLYIGCIERDDGEWTFLVTNYNRLPVTFCVTLDRSIGDKTLTRYVYDPVAVTPDEQAEMIPVSGRLEHVTDSFSDQIPKGAVAVYTTCPQ